VIKRVPHLVLALLPLTVGLALLPLMPQLVQAPLILGPRSLVRVDPLGLAAIVLLAFGAARPQHSFFYTLRQSFGVVLAGVALLLSDAVLQLALFSIVSLLLFGDVGWDWYLALLFLGIASLPSSVVPSLPVLIVATFVGIGGISPPTPLKVGSSNVPAASSSRTTGPTSLVGRADFLRPIWLFLLMRSLVNGPWPLQWTLLVPLVGIAAALWVVASSFVAGDDAGDRQLSLAALLLGFASLGFGTSLGVAATLWIVLLHSLLLIRNDDTGGGTGTVPFLALLFATWWTAAAAAGARSMMPVGAAWLVGMAGGAAALLRSRFAGVRPWHILRRDRLLLVLLGAAGVASGVLTRFVAEPVVAQVGAGLSAFGLLDTWPWIGVAGLDPGHRRVAILPLAPVGLLLLVLAAMAWLSRRLWLRRDVSPGEQADPFSIGAITRRVWWLPGGGDG
jgi:hypothetical protein